MKHDADQVLIFRLGPWDGVYTVQVESIRLAYVAADREALVK